MAAKIWIALYKPHPGQEPAVRELIAKHYPLLQRLGLITDRPGIVAKTSNGTFMEIAEWKHADAARQAHEHPEVKKVWEAMGAIADFPGLGSLEEAAAPFPHFEPVHF